MRIFKHKDYNHYYESQVKKYEKKKNNVWIKIEEVRLICDHASKHIGKVNNGICHGTRTGWEIQKFRKFLKADIIGTEIAPNNIPNTIVWDFHKIKDKWIDKFDFIYSNSLDHSDQPEHCIDQWMKCLKPSGICYIHWMVSNLKKFDAADCFSASLKEFKKLLNKKYIVVDEFKKYSGRIVLAVKHREKYDGTN